MENYRKIASKEFPDVILRVVPGHFVTPNSHVNYYLDMTAIKSRMTEARAAAKALSSIHYYTTPVDTIVCLDGTEIIGAYLAEELSKAGVISMNAHKSIYVLTPEYSAAGQMIFRENLQPWIRGKNVLLLLASATTGTTIVRAVESLRYYGAAISGLSAIFSIATKIGGLPVYSIFSKADLPDYASYSHEECVLCRNSQKVDGICNGFGLSPL
ncbi:MAG: phosphoribosyltransferase [Clostridiales bacterium]|nr:phosphoribosyltransferase [Clostridiales bacterium]